MRSTGNTCSSQALAHRARALMMRLPDLQECAQEYLRNYPEIYCPHIETRQQRMPLMAHLLATVGLEQERIMDGETILPRPAHPMEHDVAELLLLLLESMAEEAAA